MRILAQSSGATALPKHPTNMTGKARIHRNIYGNWNGYIGRCKVWEIGASESDANQWLERQTFIQNGGLRGGFAPLQ